MDSYHKATRSGCVDRPLCVRNIEVSQVKRDGREEGQQSAETIEDDHRGHALLWLGSTVSPEGFVVSQPLATTLTVGIRTLISCAAVRTKHSEWSLYLPKSLIRSVPVL